MKKNLTLYLLAGTLAALISIVTLTSCAGGNCSAQTKTDYELTKNNIQSEMTDNFNVEKPEPFEVFFERFMKMFNNKNSAEIDKCIHSEYGFFVLDNPGAFWVSQHFNSFTEIMKLEGEYDVAYLKVMKVDCNYVKGKEPVFSCEEDKWSKEGCFLDDNPKKPISRLYESMIEYQLGDVNILKSELDHAKKSELLISHLVYSTDSRIGFYFGNVNGKWLLFCINKIMPCSA